MGVDCINWWVWSVSIGECGLYQLVGVVFINLVGGCGGLYQLMGVVCINWWVWSTSNGVCGLYQMCCLG